MPTPGEPSTEEKLNALHAQLVDAVAELVRSEKWSQMLAVAARFTTYSPSNVLLIAVQRPDATRVAGIRTWNSLGRRVNKGEHGIAILAPCVYRTQEEAAAKDDGAVVERADDGGMPRRELRGFRVVHVFDVSQTEGTPLPDARPRRLTGDAPLHAWEGLVRLTSDAGYRLERRTCPDGVNGWTAPLEKLVVVDAALEPAQAVKTLAHELGHIRANHAGRFPEYGIDPVCRGAAEVEAESIAYIVTSHLGMQPDDYSVPYVAGWADGTEALRQHVSTAVNASQSLLADLEKQPQATSGTSGRELETGRPVLLNTQVAFAGDPTVARHGVPETADGTAPRRADHPVLAHRVTQTP